MKWNKEWHDLCYIHSLDQAKKKRIGHWDYYTRKKAINRWGFWVIWSAENCAAGHNNKDPAKLAVHMWEHSPGHRKNMLKGHTYMSAAAAKGTNGAYYFT